MYHTFIVISSAEGRLDSSHFLDIVTKAAMSMVKRASVK